MFKACGFFFIISLRKWSKVCYSYDKFTQCKVIDHISKTDWRNGINQRTDSYLAQTNILPCQLDTYVPSHWCTLFSLAQLVSCDVYVENRTIPHIFPTSSQLYCRKIRRKLQILERYTAKNVCTFTKYLKTLCNDYI